MAGLARLRLDAELVRRNLARSREHASQLIAAGRVTVGGTTATKPATQVEKSAAVVVKADDGDPDYVSRGGHKLAGALAAFTPLGLEVTGRRALDAGASTGGFTDVLLRPTLTMWWRWTSDTDNSPGLFRAMNASPSRTVRTYVS